MEAFSYQQHHPLLPDSPNLPTFPFEMPFPVQQFGEMRNDSASCFSYYCSPEAIQEVSAIDARAYESSSSFNISSTSVGSEMALSSVGIQPHHEKIPKQQGSMEKRRKNGYGDCLRCDQSKETKEINRRDQRKHNGELKRKRKKSKGVDSKATVAGQEASVGYVLVRAGRGQATDSHSLAERVRREKISARMKKLQGLVPGCDKVTGKALLDEIICYIRSLQNQVELLSMKLASVNSMLYGFGVDLVDCMNTPQNMGIIPQEVQLVSQTTHVPPTANGNTTENYQIMDPSAPLSLHCQGPIAFPQDGGSLMMQVGEQRQQCFDQVEFNDMCFFLAEKESL